MKKLFSFFLIIALGYAAYHFSQGKSLAAEKQKPKIELDKTFEAKRGDFNITLKIDGSLSANKNYSLRTQLSGRYPLTVESLVLDKTEVKKGDVLCQISAAKYEESLEKKTLDLSDIKKNKELALEELASQKIDNVANVKNASISLRQSQEALDRYLNEDSPRTKRSHISSLRNAEQNIENAEKALSLSQKRLDENQDQERRGALLSDRDNKNKELEAKIKLREDELYKLKIFKQYSYPTKISSLQEDLQRKKRSLRKAIFNANSRLNQNSIKIKNYNRRIERAEADIKTITDDMANLKIIAPIDGILHWGDPRRRQLRQEEFKVGSKVNSRNIIGTIPDLSKFQVEADLPESYRSFVSEGLKVKISNKALPDLKLNGQIKSISTVAKRSVHWNPKSPKVYSLVISTEEHDPRLTPGMSMYLEIVVERVQNKIFVPIEAVYSSEGKSYCRVLKDDQALEREVQTGKFSNNYIVLEKGVESHERVLLHRADK